MEKSGFSILALMRIELREARFTRFKPDSSGHPSMPVNTPPGCPLPFSPPSLTKKPLGFLPSRESHNSASFPFPLFFILLAFFPRYQ